MARQMLDVVVVEREAVKAKGCVEDGRLLIAPSDLQPLIGWTLKPEGLCQEGSCVVLRDRESIERDGLLDLESICAQLRLAYRFDAQALTAAVAVDPLARSGALEGLQAPDFTLPDLDGKAQSWSQWDGHKRLLVTFSSWCGCRYDLPGWQALADDLADTGLVVICVALDQDPEEVRPFVDGIRLPVLYDPHHLLAELYAISNVPTVVWVDEEGMIVRPNGLIFGTDTFADFTGVDSTPQLAAMARWARDGELPLLAAEAKGAVADLSDIELEARLAFKLGAQCLRDGKPEAARRNLEEASRLAPFDFSVRRAAMPLLGKDPFGDEFLEVYDQWQAQGAPYHGVDLDSSKNA